MCIRDSVYTVDKFKNAAQELLDENSGLKYAVFYVDFADFKYINDVFGYEMCIRDSNLSGADRSKSRQKTGSCTSLVNNLFSQQR